MQSNLNESFIAAEKQVAAEITELLTKTVTQTNYKFLSLPYVTYRGSPVGKIATVALSEAVADECSTGKPLDALMAVISGSTCQLVAELRKAIAERYVYGNASDIAEVTA
jgi:hypothetical protein